MDEYTLQVEKDGFYHFHSSRRAEIFVYPKDSNTSIFKVDLTEEGEAELQGKNDLAVHMWIKENFGEVVEDHLNYLEVYGNEQ